MVATHLSQNQNKSKIEERIEWAKQKAKESLDIYAYSIILEGLYKLAREKAPEVLPQLEELVERTGVFTFDIQLLSTIRDYIRDYIPPIEYYYRWKKLKIPKENIHNLKEGLEYMRDISKAFGDYIGNNIYYIGKYVSDNIYSKTKIYRITPSYREKIKNLKEGLEKLLDWDVKHYLFELYWGIRSGEFIPLDFNFYLERVSWLAYFTGQRLDWKTQRMYAQEEAAYNYLYSHIKCLLSNPEGYIQHMKAGDLGAFIRESCNYTTNWSWTKAIKELGKELKEYISNLHKGKNYTSN
jgi:hypothetical protein